MEYDDFLEKVGGFGRYQILVFILLSFSGMKAGIEMQLVVYYVFPPEFSCVEPWNSTFGNETCTIFDGENTTKCTKWSYDRSVLRKTVTTEFDLVCDKAFYRDLFITLGFIGNAIGSCVSFSGDTIGRRKLILFSAIYEFVTSIALVFVPSMPAVFALWLLRGSGSRNFTNGFTYLTEIVSSRYIAVTGTIFWINASLGYALAGAIGKYVQEWRYMQLIGCSLTVTYISYFFLVWESPRWLLAVGRKTEAIEVLKRVAKFNGRANNLIEEEYEDLRVEEKGSQDPFYAVFSTPWMRTKTLISWFGMWVYSVSYFGIILDSGFSTTDIFLNTVYMGIIEVPSYIVSAIVGAKLGRRWPTIVLSVFTSIIIFSVPHFPADSLMWLKTFVAIAGKFCITTSFTIFFLWATEIQPVSVRNIGFFSSVICCYLGAICAPYFLRLSDIRVWLPSIVMGSQCFVASLLLIFLPETKDVALQQTVEEADLLVPGREKKFKQRLADLHASDLESEVMLESRA